LSSPMHQKKERATYVALSFFWCIGEDNAYSRIINVI